MSIHLDLVTKDSIAAAKQFNEQARRSVEHERSLICLERLCDEHGPETVQTVIDLCRMWGLHQTQRWLDGAVAIREDARRW